MLKGKVEIFKFSAITSNSTLGNVLDYTFHHWKKYAPLLLHAGWIRYESSEYVIDLVGKSICKTHV